MRGASKGASSQQDTRRGHSLVEQALASASQLLRGGSPAQAFDELLRASRSLPMSVRLAAGLVACALRAGTGPAAVACLSEALEGAAGPTRLGLYRSLIRLQRRTGELTGARSSLQALLAEYPEDRRALRLLGELSRSASLGPYPRRPRTSTQPLLEARLIARKAWKELVEYYQERAERAAEPAVRAEALARLAEVLESELEDMAGAARAYGELVALTGDRTALEEQLRLLAQSDAGRSERALDEAIQRAASPRARATALLARAERRLAGGQRESARTDFAAALALTPSSLQALAGLALCASKEELPQAVERLRAALEVAPRRAPHRGASLRRLAELTSGELARPAVARWAWSEVLAENPEDTQAHLRLRGLARESGDGALLVRLLREQLRRQPRGEGAQALWEELVATLEALGQPEAALEALREAVEVDLTHRQAWLLLAQRLARRGQREEAADALEEAAKATEDELERLHAWERAIRFCLEVLGDRGRARVNEARAERLRQSLARQEPAPKPPARASQPRSPTPPETNLATTVVRPVEAPLLQAAAERTAPLNPEGAFSSTERARKPPRRTRTRTGLHHAFPSPEQPPLELLELAQAYPLEAAPYRKLAAALAAQGQSARSALMEELAAALEGRSEQHSPLPPRLRLNAQARVRLRHPRLRHPATELLTLTGSALCRLFPATGPAAGALEPLRPESSPAARVTSEALQEASRILGLELPEVAPAQQEEAPPFSLVHTLHPRLLVGRRMLRQALPAAQLRFLAGRTLACLEPALLALHVLLPHQLLRALDFLDSVLQGGSRNGPEVRLLHEALSRPVRQRAAALLEPARGELDLSVLAEAALHTANRAGLVACGEVGPAVAALRALRSPAPELAELLRFATSEAYFSLRSE